MTFHFAGRTGWCSTLLLGASLLALPPLAPAVADTPKDQLVIGTSLAQVLSLDPQQATEAKAVEIMANTYDRLVMYTPNDPSTIKPQLAESWQADDMGITFTLREASFASGNPVTAADVVYSIGRLLKLNQAAAANYTRMGYSAENVDQMVRVVDERTVRIDYAPATNEEFLLYRLAMVVGSIVDSEEVKRHAEGDDYGNNWLRTNSAGSGPFTLNRWTPNDIVLLNRNDEFWGKEPAMRRVVMRHVPESQVERLMLERGDIDVANAMNAGDIVTFQNKEGFEVQRVPVGGFYVLSMNAGNQYLANPDVRRAIAYGIDYKGIETSLLGPYGRARHVPVPVDWPNAIPDPDWQFDPAQAKALLAKAGYPDGFSLTLKTIAQPPRIDIATAIQGSLAQIGVRVEIRQGNGSEIIAAHRARDFDLLMPQTGAYMPNALGSMEQFTSNPDNSREANNAGNFVWRSAWDIPELTKLTADASAERDPVRRGTLYEAIQRSFVDSAPAVLPMFERFEPIVVRSDVQGYAGHPLAVTRLEDVTKTNN